MLSKLKAYAVIVLSLALAVLYALFNKEKAARQRDKEKAAHKAAQVLSGANDAIRAAEIREKEKLDAKSDRNRFY